MERGRGHTGIQTRVLKTSTILTGDEWPELGVQNAISRNKTFHSSARLDRKRHLVNAEEETSAEEEATQDPAVREPACQRLERPWEGHVDIQAQDLETPNIVTTEDNSLRSVEELRKIAAQYAKSRKEAFGKSKAARAIGDEDEAWLVSMHGTGFDQFVFRCD